jgi:SAM-dependent methyltransferase
MQVNVCPGCGNPDFELAPGRGQSFDTEVKGRVFRQPDYVIKRCVTCDLCYKSQILDDAGRAEYYQQIDFAKWDYDGLFPSERAVLKILFELPPGSRVLDYGCSTGRLLAEVAALHRCFGVEVRWEAAELAAQRGIEIVSDKQIADSSELRFDAVILCDLFEHLSAPTLILQQLRRSLDENGLIVICSGNADSKACRKDLANFWYFRNSEHLCMLGRRHAEYLARLLDLKLMNWIEVSHYDCSLLEKLRQHTQDFAYWRFNQSNKWLWPYLLRFVPFINRARNWNIPSALSCTKDHVVAVFKDQALRDGSK